MKFLLVDDHALFRHGLRLLLAGFPGNPVFLEAGNCAAAFAEAAVHADIDLILLDLALPDLNGLDGLVRLRELCPTTPVVLLSANENTPIILDGLRRGAQGFIPKSSSPDVMVAALQVILAGGIYVPATGVAGRAEPAGGNRALTARQREVLALLVKNRSNKEIAQALDMRVNTVRVHVAAILKILDVENRNDAARVALGLGVANGG
ncbi:MAG: response regulator transcription factor [Gallionellaceae bacterium]|nr:response regulator transcription factor [Gallionellaceae bacterium]